MTKEQAVMSLVMYGQLCKSLLEVERFDLIDFKILRQCVNKVLDVLEEGVITKEGFE